MSDEILTGKRVKVLSPPTRRGEAAFYHPLHAQIGIVRSKMTVKATRLKAKHTAYSVAFGLNTQIIVSPDYLYVIEEFRK